MLITVPEGEPDGPSNIVREFGWGMGPREGLPRGGFSLLRKVMTTWKKENVGQCDLANPQLHQVLAKVDGDLAEEVRQRGCIYCGGKLHRANYERKPRSGSLRIEELLRDSFCCDQDGCRKRHTPPSVRFLGRRVYWGVVVVLVSAVRHGLTPERMRVLRKALGIDRRTVERWRQWWLETFVQSSFWKRARARFMPPVCEQSLPLSLGQAFHLARPGQLIEFLRFLSPLTTGSIPWDRLD